MAEEAANKAKQLRLQALRAKVAQSSKKDENTEELAAGDDKKEGDTAAVESLAKDISQLSVANTSSTGAGLQSPTSGAWKATETSGDSIGEALRTVQSPTTSSWKPPAESSLAEETFAGARVESASAEEIKKVESETAIEEEEEPEEEKKAEAEKTAA